MPPRETASDGAISVHDDAIDVVVDFTDEDGDGIGKGHCLQLKAGNSHLTKRKTDGPGRSLRDQEAVMGEEVDESAMARTLANSIATGHD